MRSLAMLVIPLLFATCALACGSAREPARASGGAAAGTPASQTSVASGPKLTVPAEAEGTVDQLRRDARAVRSLVHTKLALRFLDGAERLPHVTPHPVYRTADKSRWLTEADAAALSPEERRALTAVTVDEPLYYETKYGSPLAYARAFDVLGEHGVSLRDGAAYADFGYGGIGSLLMSAAASYRATGIDVDPMLPVIYAGAAAAYPRVTLLSGRFPADPAIVRGVGAGLSLFLAKNTLKRGYVHPDRPADDKFLMRLGVSDEAFIAAVHDALEPRGVFFIYNICPALSPPDKPFVPWSDGRSPFSRAQLEAGGFEVLEFDRDDLPVMRALARALRWDEGEDAMDLDHDLSVLYTLARRRD